jgi:hypothetical protein
MWKFEELEGNLQMEEGNFHVSSKFDFGKWKDNWKDFIYWFCVNMESRIMMWYTC